VAMTVGMKDVMAPALVLVMIMRLDQMLLVLIVTERCGW